MSDSADAVVTVIRAIRGLLLLLTLALGVEPAAAQTRLYVLFAGVFGIDCQPQDCPPGQVLDIDVDGRRLLSSTPVLHARVHGVGPRVTPDGRYLLWTGTEHQLSAPSYLSLLDVSARQQSVPVVTGGIGNAPISALFAHSSVMRVFLQSGFGADVTIAEPGRLRTLPVPCQSEVRDVSGDGARLFARCGSSVFDRTVVVDSTTGTLLATVPDGSSYQVPDEGGAVLYTAAWRTVGQPPVDRRYDVATGAVLAEHTGAVNDCPDDPMLLDPRTGHLLAGASNAVRMLDGVTLAPLSRRAAPFGFAKASVAFDPERPLAYVVWSGVVTTGGYQTRIQVVDTTTLTTVIEADLPVRTRVVGVVLGPRPPRATNLSAAVAGSAVTLRWTNESERSIATGLVLEAGSGPGAADLARLPMAAGATSLTVTGVPRGTYYVRVRSANGSGLGEPSNEVTVVVQ